MNNSELFLKCHALELLRIINKLDSAPLSLDNNPELKEALLMSGEVLARSIGKGDNPMDVVAQRTIKMVMERSK